MILKEGEISEEKEEDEEEQQLVLPKKDIEIKIEPLLINEEAEQEIVIYIQNNMDKPIKDVNLDVSLKSKSLLSKPINEIKSNESIFLKFLTPKLKSGEYELEIEFSSQFAKFKESRKLFVKKKTKISKSSLDSELKKFLGE